MYNLAFMLLIELNLIFLKINKLDSHINCSLLQQIDDLFNQLKGQITERTRKSKLKQVYASAVVSHIFVGIWTRFLTIRNLNSWLLAAESLTASHRGRLWDTAWRHNFSTLNMLSIRLFIWRKNLWLSYWKKRFFLVKNKEQDILRKLGSLNFWALKLFDKAYSPYLDLKSGKLGVISSYSARIMINEYWKSCKAKKLREVESKYRLTNLDKHIKELHYLNPCYQVRGRKANHDILLRAK